MNHPRYKIVFDGQLMPETTLETVKDNLASLLKSDQSHIDTLFSGNPTILKHDMNENEADQYLSALQKAGANARKELDQTASLSLVPIDEEAEQAEIPNMSCPKCGHEQSKANVCIACGIAIEKYLAHTAQMGEQPQPVATVDNTSPYTPPQADVTESLPEFGELNAFSTNGRIGRIRYIGWQMALILCLLSAMGVGFGLATLSPTMGTLFTIIITLTAFGISVFISVQRLHDIDWSGWWLLLYLIPLISNVLVLLLAIIPGTQNANRFGSPPPPNSTAVKILAWMAVLIPVIAITAAIIIRQN